MIPALRSTVKVVLREWLNEDAELYDVPELMTAALLRATARAEATAAMVAASIPRATGDIPVHATVVGEIITLVGVRAMETADIGTILNVRETVASLTTENRFAPEMLMVGSVLTAACCWSQPSRSHDQLGWFVRLPRGTGTTRDRAFVAGLVRIGGAALLASLPSVAVKAAFSIAAVEPDLAAIRARMLSEDSRAREDLHSSIRGQYLGSSPSDAIKNFLDLAEVVVNLPSSQTSP